MNFELELTILRMNRCRKTSWREFFASIPTIAAIVFCSLLMGCRPSPEKEGIPAVVHGASMSPTLWGAHYRLTCRECRYPIAYFLEPEDEVTRHVVCSNCGFEKNLIETATPQPAQLVRLVSIEQQPIKRWDLVAFRFPDSRQAGIKRAVGLPGEEIRIRDGNLFADGILLVKPYEVQKQFRISVYDSAYSTSQFPLSFRWIESLSDPEPSSWKAEDCAWRYQQRVKQAEIDSTSHLSNIDSNGGEPERESHDSWAWLAYQHWRGCGHMGQRTDVFPIEDVDHFNPSLSRPLNPTHELFFKLECHFSEDAEFGFRHYVGQDRIELKLNLARRELLWQVIAAEQVTDSRSSDRLASIESSVKLPSELFAADATRGRNSHVIEISTVDNQLLFLIDQRVLLAAPFPSPRNRPTEKIFEIGASRGFLTVSRIRIWRDVYYLPQTSDIFRLGEDRYLMLGDNVTVSVDSRQWQPAGICRKNIVGVLKVDEPD